MVDAFTGTYIIEMNVDDPWNWDEASLMGYNSDFIPVLFEVGENGFATGRQIDGSAWAENIPENMAPPLKAFFKGEG